MWAMFLKCWRRSFFAFGRVLLFSPFLCLHRCRCASSLKVLLCGCRRNEELSDPPHSVCLCINISVVNKPIHGIKFHTMPILENLSPVLTQNDDISGHPLASQWGHSLQRWMTRCPLLNPGKDLNQESLLFSHCLMWRKAFPTCLCPEFGLHNEV